MMTVTVSLAELQLCRMLALRGRCRGVVGQGIHKWPSTPILSASTSSEG
jgi:hypothetical protein